MIPNSAAGWKAAGDRARPNPPYGRMPRTCNYQLTQDMFFRLLSGSASNQPDDAMASPDAVPALPDDRPNGHAALSADLAERLLARLDAVEAKLDRLAPALDAAPAAVAAATDVFDDHAARLRDRGVDVEVRLGRLLALAERLTDDRTHHALEQVLDLADQAPGLASMVVDVLDDAARQLAEEGLDVEVGLSRGARAALRFGQMVGPREIDALQTLLASEALAPEAVQVVSAAAQALVECQGRERQRVGPLGLLRALRDPDVQRALDFLVGVGRRFGRALDAGPPSADVVRRQSGQLGPPAR